VETRERVPSTDGTELNRARAMRNSGASDFRETWDSHTWTRDGGNYLEPDARFGYGFLDAVRRVFGTKD
jgi:hypothetical protein